MPVTSRKWILGAAIVIAVGGALTFAFWPRPVAVDLGTVSRGELQIYVADEGETRVRDVYTVSAPLPGRVLRIDSDVGDQVLAGQTIVATLRPTDPTFLDTRTQTQAEATVRAAQAALALADAEVLRAEAELTFARSELNRSAELALRQNVSERALERAKLDADIARAALRTAEANRRVRAHELETARAMLITPSSDRSKTEACCVEIRAPTDGSVLKVFRESEGVVAAGEPLVEIGDPRALEIVVDLLSIDAVQVDVGDEVVIEGWGGDQPLAGRVRRVEPFGFTKTSALGIDEQRVNVIVDLTSPAELWRRLGHGYRVETRILVWQQADALKVPSSALFRDGQAWAVYAREEDRARVQHVTVGRTNGVEALVVDGLAEGAEVVVYPSDRVSAGVRIVERGS